MWLLLCWMSCCSSNTAAFGVFWKESVSLRSHMQEEECLFCKGFCPWLSSFITISKTMNLKGPCIKHAVLYISPIVNKHKIHLTRAKQKKVQLCHHLLTLVSNSNDFISSLEHKIHFSIMFIIQWQRAVKLRELHKRAINVAIVHIIHALYCKSSESVWFIWGTERNLQHY